MKTLLFLALLICSATATAHLHEDWATVHRVNAKTHELIHTASTSSSNRLAVLTLSCDKTLTMHETRTHSQTQQVETFWYSVDGEFYKKIPNEKTLNEYSTIRIQSNSDKVVANLEDGRDLRVLVRGLNDGEHSYTFSLRGMNDAYHTLGLLCKW
ncbi:hypothetical protein NVP1081O_166 [Vibrio phage 1.081.O._10N.286.52.C2]|nr:hypothetical protein NVP1081O_166 [Vibrio phage 1.081.O._10N.286.52.C2]